MIIGCSFQGDENKALKDVQFRLYGQNLWRIFSKPRERYLDACRLVERAIEPTRATRGGS